MIGQGYVSAIRQAIRSKWTGPNEALPSVSRSFFLRAQRQSVRAIAGRSWIGRSPANPAIVGRPGFLRAKPARSQFQAGRSWIGRAPVGPLIVIGLPGFRRAKTPAAQFQHGRSWIGTVQSGLPPPPPPPPPASTFDPVTGVNQWWLTSGSSEPSITTTLALLLETGQAILLENGQILLMENSGTGPPITTGDDVVTGFESWFSSN